MKSIGFFGLVCCWSTALYAIPDTDALSGRIANSIQQLPGPQYKTIAISRIKKVYSSLALDINELIDYTNVKLVRARRFRVTDRTRLQDLLKEQSIQTSDFVSPNEYKELGKLLGVQLFVYGNAYQDALVLKAIDVQNSGIAWSDIFTLDPDSINHLLLHDLRTKLVQSLRPEVDNLRKEGISKISFWNMKAPRLFKSRQIIDYLTASLSKQQLFTVIDRDNLKLIGQEQKLNQNVFIDESQARALGELHGVDAFIYGNISSKGSNSYIASLKMMSTYTGVIVWADLIKFTLPNTNQSETLANPFEEKIRKRQKSDTTTEGMVRISKGTFIIGSDDPAYNSGPIHRIRLPEFYLDAYEVTNKQYKTFVDETNHRFPTSWRNKALDPNSVNHPVVGVSWEDAKLYCQFRKKRLPTEEEWEAAFRGRKGRLYPWEGPNFSPKYAVTSESGVSSSVSVMIENRDITPEKIYHLAGNVREFVEDIYRPYPGGPNIEIKSKCKSPRVVRGSSWAFRDYETAGYYRDYTCPNFAWPDVGIRCAKSK